ncbi:MAG TPA: hypothetical protein VJL83_01315 [Patescibacteria group bacterium]|nr:hypothetical protein [Patescibacteria group bacterium]
MGTNVELETQLGGSFLNKPGHYHVEDNQTKIFYTNLIDGRVIVKDYCDTECPEDKQVNYTHVITDTNIALHTIMLGSTEVFETTLGGKITVTPTGPSVEDR